MFAPDPPTLDAGATPETSPPRWRRIEAVVNVASGSVAPGAVEELRAACEGRAGEVEVRGCQPREVPDALRAALASAPDVLIVLAGDGTAGLAAELCGRDGPLLAPLAGGTMNMLPHALYGLVPWREALDAILHDGEARAVPGGTVNGRAFFCAAILGAPAWWAPAREAVRQRKLRLAWLRARRALMRAFRRRLRYALDGGEERKTEALTFLSPLISRALDAEDGLEACALDPRGAADAFRIGARALFSDLAGGWRADPAVDARVSRRAAVRAHGRIPGLLDGELHRFDEEIDVRYVPEAFRALVPRSPGTLPETTA